MEQSGDNTLAHLLLPLLDDPERLVRLCAARSLGHLRLARSVDALCALAKDTDPDTRWFVARALGELGDAQASPTLGVLVQGEVPFVRRAAAQALGRTGGVEALPKLLLALQDPADPVRRAAAESLGRLADPSSVEALIRVLVDPSSWVSEAAFRALKAIGAAHPEAGLSILLETGGDPRKLVHCPDVRISPYRPLLEARVLALEHAMQGGNQLCRFCGSRVDDCDCWP